MSSIDSHPSSKKETKLAGSARLTVGNKQYELPVVSGTHRPDVVDISRLYSMSCHFTYDPRFASTAACKSGITYMDGERRRLPRAIPVERL